MAGQMVGIPRASQGFSGRFGMNSQAPAVGGSANPQAAGDVPWYESGPFWVLVFLIVGYILVFQTLKS